MRNQIARGSLGTSQLFEQRTIRSAFVGMTRHLKRRPEPRARFDDVAERGAVTTPGWKQVEAARDCLAAASVAGTLAETRTEVAHYFDTLKLAALRGFEATDACLEIAMVEHARETSEASTAAMAFAVDRTPDKAHRLFREVREAIEAGKHLLSLTHAAAHTTTQRRHAQHG